MRITCYCLLTKVKAFNSKDTCHHKESEALTSFAVFSGCPTLSLSLSLVLHPQPVVEGAGSRVQQGQSVGLGGADDHCAAAEGRGAALREEGRNGDNQP